MEWIESPNFTKGRGGKKINKIVIHWFGVGTIDGAISSFKNPNRKASAHYLISDDRAVQMVDEANTAWHAGMFSVNQESIGIEHDANPDKILSDASYKTSGKLVREICQRHNIPLDLDHIRPHRDFAATQCPGTIDLSRIIEEAKQEQPKEEVPMSDGLPYNQHAAKLLKEDQALLQFINLVVIRALEGARQGVLGEIDPVGREADTVAVINSMFRGEDYMLRDIILNIINSDQAKRQEAARIDAAVSEASKECQATVNDLKSQIEALKTRVKSLTESTNKAESDKNDCIERIDQLAYKNARLQTIVDDHSYCPEFMMPWDRIKSGLRDLFMFK